MLKDIFGADPSYNLLNPIKGDLTLLFATLFGIGLIFAVAYFVLNGFFLATSGSNIGKSSSAILGLKNVCLGLAVLLIGLPLLLAIIEGLRTAF